MSLGELLIILLVIMVIFGPKQLPMLASHLAKLLQSMHRAKAKLYGFLQQQQLAQQLQENTEKAKQADQVYQAQDTSSAD